MLEITESGVRHLAEVGVATDGTGVIRVAVIGGGRGSGLGLFADTAVASDVVSRHGDYTLVVDRHLLDYCQTITIDFQEGRGDEGCSSRSGRGFILTTAKPLLF